MNSSKALWASLTVALILPMLLSAQSNSKGSDYQIVSRGPDHRVWQRVLERRGKGPPIQERQSYTELASGMHYFNQSRWEETREEIALSESGAVADRGRYKVHFKSNPKTTDAVTLTLPDGQKMRSRVLGLAYTDPATGESVLLAETKDCVGELAPPNQVIFRDAFDGLKADLRYTYRRGSFSQDVILQEDPVDPRRYGLEPESVNLEVLTEFFEAPNPRSFRLGSQWDAAGSAAGVSVPNDGLDFGAMQMLEGRAFSLGREQKASVRVYKTWEKIGGRQFLIEAAKYSAVREELQRLPKTAATGRMSNRNRYMAHAGRAIPKLSTVSVQSKPQPMRLASSSAISTGYVLDYEISIVTAQDFTFFGSDTYVINGPFTVTGKLVIEGGSVIKYRPNCGASVIVAGSLECRTSPYRMAVFTAVDDNTVGAWIDFGLPAGYYASEALRFSTAATLKHVRILHAACAVSASAPVEIWDAQFRQCGTCVHSLNTWVGLFNVLSYGFENLLDGSGSCRAEHLSARSGSELWANLSSFTTVTLVNSLVVEVPYPATFGLPLMVDGVVCWDQENPGYFESIVSGQHYQPEVSPLRGMGSLAAIDDRLQAILRQRTTQAPKRLTGSISANLILRPNGYIRYPETGSYEPDLGYHYPVVDFSVSGAELEAGVTVKAEGGAAVALDFQANGWGFILKNGAKFISEGSPMAYNILTRDALVQEMESAKPDTRAWFYDYAEDDWMRPADSEVRFRYTELDQFSDDAFLLYTGYKLAGLEWSHSRHYNGWIALGINTDGAGQSCGITNSLFERSSIYHYAGASPSTFSLVACNNLFRGEVYDGGPHGFITFDGGALNWQARDNVFEGVVFYGCTASGLNTKNALYNTTGTWPIGLNNLTLTSLSYERGLNGEYYVLSSVPTLQDAGSRLARDIGLYHFTTQALQTKEGGSTVDIGLHYPALSRPNTAKRAASQSSDWGTAAASRAIDGNRDGNMDHGSVSHTMQNFQAWWQVDLGQVQAIQTLRLWNRTDCCGSRLCNFYVLVSDQPFVSTALDESRAQGGVSSYYVPGTAGTPTELVIGRSGRYVRVQLSGTDYLHIAEVEIVMDSISLKDSDSDGFFDVTEDPNGNGLVDSGETTFNDADSDDDGLNDGLEAPRRRNPLVPEGNLLWLRPAP